MMIRPSLPRALFAFSLLLAPAATPLAPASAQAQSTPKTDLAAVNRAIRSITTLRAGFTQTDRSGQVQSGTLLLKQPGRIRFDYKDVPLLIVADGKSLNLIDYEVKQVQRWPIRNSPLGALLDPARDLARYGKLIPASDPKVVSVEVRDPAHPEYGVITLIFTQQPSAPGGLAMFGWVAKDAQGNRTTVRLINPVYGAAIADSAFGWTDPRPNQRGPVR
jgi:outer membrane lipoprotein-sorting protein